MGDIQRRGQTAQGTFALPTRLNPIFCGAVHLVHPEQPTLQILSHQPDPIQMIH
eukprot:SAG31_NODE_7887_length_1573_cov_1.139756_3_plen_53_part_01